MPLYEYACRRCGGRFERMRKVSERLAPAECPECGAVSSALVPSAPAHVGAAAARPASACASGAEPDACCGGMCLN